MRIYVDGVSVFQASTPGNFSFYYTMTAGTHVLQVDLIELTSSAVIQFQWQPSDGGGVVATALPAATTAPPGPAMAWETLREPAA